MKRNDTQSLASMVQSFFHDRLIAQRRASPTTVSAYRDGIRLFLTYAARLHETTPSELSLVNLDRETVLAFLESLEVERGNSIRTRNVRLAAVRAFFKHVAYQDPGMMAIVERVLAIEEKRVTKPAIRYLSRNEMEAILAAPDRCTPTGRRWYALLLFLARTGARVSEATRVSVVDIRFDVPRQVRLVGKGSRERIVPLDKETARALRSVGTGASDNYGVPVMINARSKRLTRHGANHIVRQVATIASEKCSSLAGKRISPHLFRHTLAMNLLQSGVDLTVIQAWLGHAGLGTTHAYVEADIEMKRRALQRAGIVDQGPVRYQPTDSILQILENL